MSNFVPAKGPVFTALQYHSKRWNSIAKWLGLVKCKNCQERGGIWKAYDPGFTGWIRYCYKCSWKEEYIRRVDINKNVAEINQKLREARAELARREQQ